MSKRGDAGRRVPSPDAFRLDVLAWAVRLRVKPTGVYVQRMTRKWGSCSRKGRLCFAIDLLQKPPKVRTVVMVHELLHLVVPNHGKLFRSLMSAYVPGWRGMVVANGRDACGRPPVD